LNTQHAKNVIINAIIRAEGGYVNDPSDSGGETNYGITKAVARANGYSGEMKDMFMPAAFDIYEKEYWHSMRLDEIATLSLQVASELADTGVNMGTVRAIKFLQRSLNVLNHSQEYYDDMLVDGLCGNTTVKACRSYYNHRGDAGMRILTSMLNCLQGAFYVDLAERREKDEKFIYGWFTNRVG